MYAFDSTKSLSLYWLNCRIIDVWPGIFGGLQPLLAQLLQPLVGANLLSRLSIFYPFSLIGFLLYLFQQWLAVVTERLLRLHQYDLTPTLIVLICLVCLYCQHRDCLKREMLYLGSLAHFLFSSCHYSYHYSHFFVDLGGDVLNILLNRCE